MHYVIIIAALFSFMASSPVFADNVKDDVSNWRVGAILDVFDGNELASPGDYLECNGQEIPIDSKYDDLRDIFGKHVPDYPPRQFPMVFGTDTENGYLIKTINTRRYVRSVPYFPPAPRLTI